MDIARLYALLTINACTHSTAAIPVFDCEAQGTTFKTLDLNEAKDCPDPDTDYHPKENATVQLLQTDTDIPVHGFRCHVTVNKVVQRCGFNSLTYASNFPVWEQTMEMTPQECRNAISTKKLVIEGRTYDIELGTRFATNFYSQGGTDRSGHCYTADFTSGGNWYEESFERTELTIDIQAIRGTHDLATGMVTFTNGLTANYKDEILRDAYVGVLVWSVTESACEASISQLYHGQPPGTIWRSGG